MVDHHWWWWCLAWNLLKQFSSPADAWGQEEFGGDWGWGWRHGDAGQAIIIELVILLPFLVLLLQGGVKQHQGLGQEQDQQVQLQEEQRGREAGCLTSARFRFLQIFWQV